jgi:Leucine rich repeat
MWQAPKAQSNPVAPSLEGDSLRSGTMASKRKRRATITRGCAGIAEAEELIENARRTQAQELDLSLTSLNTPLGSLPESVWQLTHLWSLSLRNLQLSALPEAIGNLTQLQRLYLSDNRLTALPDAIGELNQLQQLNVSSNQFAAFPVAIGKSASAARFRTIYSPRFHHH